MEDMKDKDEEGRGRTKGWRFMRFLSRDYLWGACFRSCGSFLTASLGKGAYLLTVKFKDNGAVSKQAMHTGD